MPFEIVRNDITNMRVDAIVNTANPRPIVGAGTDAGIHAKAGPRLLEARKEIGRISVGEAAITPAFDLNARYVIHTVGPIWRGGLFGEMKQLRSCYDCSLSLAALHGCKSIAFPLISAGTYGFPKNRALQTALQAISDFLLEHEMQVYLVVFNREAFQLSEKLFRDVTSFIDENYVESARLWEYSSICDPDRRQAPERRRTDDDFGPEVCSVSEVCESDSSVLRPDDDGEVMYEFGTCESSCMPNTGYYPSAGSAESRAPGRTEKTKRRPKAAARPTPPPVARPIAPPPMPSMAPPPMPSAAPQARPFSMPRGETLDEMLANTDAGFSETLLKLIDRTGKKDSEIYTRANISRQHFSKIRKNPYYKPTKPTAVAFAIALELDLDQTRDLIGRAGYALTRSSKFDVIIMYFIREGNYNLYDINTTLFEFDQSLLGA